MTEDTMIASQRFEKIVELVNDRGIVNTRELSELMEVTETTIRRDCEELEKQGKLLRVHGGAKSIKQKEILSTLDEKEMRDRTGQFEEKERVCRKAASFIKNGDCIYLDGGTSVQPILKYLQGKHLKIVTNSTLLANSFHDSDSELFIIGGKYIPEYSMSVGPIAAKNLQHFNFDHAIISCSGVDLENETVYAAEMDTMNIKEQAMKNAVKSYLLIDSSKLSVKGFYSSVKSSDFDAVICNEDPEIRDSDLPDNFILVEEPPEE